MANEFYTRPQPRTTDPLYQKGINTGSEMIDYGQKIGKGFNDIISVAPESAAVGIAITLFVFMRVALKPFLAPARDSFVSVNGSRMLRWAIGFAVATLGYNSYLSTQGISVRGSEQSYKQIDGRSALPAPSGYKQLSDTFEEPSKGARGKQLPGKPFECFAPDRKSQDRSKPAPKNC